MLKRIIPFMLFSIVFLLQDLSGQSQFDRIYMLRDTAALVSTRIVQTPNEEYAIFGASATQNDTVNSLNLTFLDKKGNLGVSTDYSFDYGDGPTLFHDFIRLSEGGYLVGSHIANTEERNSKALMRLDPSGAVIWSKVLGGSESDVYATGTTFVEESPYGHYGIFGSSSNISLNNLDLFASSVNPDGELRWTKTFSAENDGIGQNLVIGETAVSIDSNYLICGVLDTAPFVQFYLTSIDTAGEVVKGYKYFDPNSLINVVPLTMKESADSSVYIGGLGIFNDLLSLGGTVTKLGPNGDPIWNIGLFNGSFNYVLDLVELDNGNLFVNVGTIVDLNFGISLSFFYEIDPDGNILSEQLNFDEGRIANFDLIEGIQMQNTADGGAVFVTNALNDDVTGTFPEIMKFDPDLSYSCLDTTFGVTVLPFELEKDTLILTAENHEQEDTLEVVVEPFTFFDVEELTLLSIAFCPNVPIDTILDATVEGGVDYIWNTGDTTAIIEVMAEGDYMVTVTVENENCYMLCDTGRITVYNEPELSLGLNFAQLCNDNSINIVAVPMAEAGVSSYMWSTGEDTPVINVSEPGSYTLTIIDNCDLSAAASIDISAEDFYMPGMIESVTVNSGTCFNGAQEIALVTSGDVETIAWNTGESNPTIFGFPNQSYSVTVTDACGAMEEESVTVNPGTAQISLETQCTNDTLNLLVTGPQAFISATWTLPDAGTVDSNRTEALDPGVYLINVIDACGNPGSAQYELSAGELFLCSGRFCEDDVPESGCLCFPRVFIPNSMIEENQSFGPANFCGGLATDYLLEVYNRWGKKVFESTTIGNDWGGLIDGELAPADVYIYYSEYSFDGQVFKRNGDVTLIR